MSSTTLMAVSSLIAYAGPDKPPAQRSALAIVFHGQVLVIHVRESSGSNRFHAATFPQIRSKNPGDQDPEERLGTPGRRVVAGLVGFGLAGMSAEFSPFGLSWPSARLIAGNHQVRGRWPGTPVRSTDLGPERDPFARHGNDQR